jgi:hypothetical protein
VSGEARKHVVHDEGTPRNRYAAAAERISALFKSLERLSSERWKAAREVSKERADLKKIWQR